MQETETILTIMRKMAWERAKGELNSMLLTYLSTCNETVYDELEKTIQQFIVDVEQNGKTDN